MVSITKEHILSSTDIPPDPVHGLEGGVLVFCKHPDWKHSDLILIINYKYFSMKLSYSTNKELELLEFRSVDWKKTVKVIDIIEMQLMLRLLSPSVKVYSEQVLTAYYKDKSNLKSSNIIIGNN